MVVGDQQETFGVHERLMRASSPFFDKAMSPEWQESVQRIIRLPEDEPEIFQLYVHWLYFGTLPVFCDEPGHLGNTEYLDLAKAYTLGDKLMDTMFQDTVIDAIIEKSRSKARDQRCWFPVGKTIEYAYSNTNESALIRKLFVDMYVRHGNPEWLHEWAEPTDLPPPFLLELASKLLDRRRVPLLEIEPSNYHIHGSDGGKVGLEKSLAS